MPGYLDISLGKAFFSKKYGYGQGFPVVRLSFLALPSEFLMLWRDDQVFFVTYYNLVSGTKSQALYCKVSIIK